jgi:hypothetical protein
MAMEFILKAGASWVEWEEQEVGTLLLTSLQK